MSIPVIETDRLFLRAFEARDWSSHCAMLSDRIAMQHMHFQHWNDEQRRSWFDHCVALGSRDGAGGSFEWVIALKPSGEAIGWIGMGMSEDPENALDIEFGYALTRERWGNGYMTEALSAVFSHAFCTLKIPQISANCVSQNEASARVMLKAGMQLSHEDESRDFEGNLARRYHFVLTLEDWRSQHPRILT